MVPAMSHNSQIYTIYGASTPNHNFNQMNNVHMTQPQLHSSASDPNLLQWFPAASNPGTIQSPYPMNDTLTSPIGPYPMVNSSISPNVPIVQSYPVLRVADDSPYGFHGAVPQKTQKSSKKKQNKPSLSWAQTDTLIPSQESHMRPYTTMASQDVIRDPGRTDFIRGSIHSSMRLPSVKRSNQDVMLARQGSLHYGFSESKRPIPGPSYGMLQQFMQNMEPAWNDRPPPQTTSPWNTQPHLEHSQNVVDPYRSHNQITISDRSSINTAASPSLPRQNQEGSYEMSMQVNQPGFEVQLEVIHHRSGSGEGQKKSKKDEIIARKKQLKPVSAKKQAKKQLSTDPREAIAELLKEQRQAESDNSDEERHNVKPSSVKKILHKKREKRNAPKVTKKSDNLAEAFTKFSSAKQNSSPAETQTVQVNQQKTRKEPPPTKPKPSKQYHQRELQSGGTGVQTQDTPEYSADSVSLAGSVGSSSHYSQHLMRLCSVCHTNTIVTDPSAIEAVTDFTSSVTGSTIYKTKKVICDNCKLKDPSYQRSPIPSIAVRAPTVESLHSSGQADVDWTARIVTIPRPDPPYESDTDSTLPDYPVSSTKSQSKKSQGKHQIVSENTSTPVQQPVIYSGTSENLYGVSVIPIQSMNANVGEMTNPSIYSNSDIHNITNGPEAIYVNQKMQVHHHGSGAVVGAPKKRDITKHFVPPPPSIPPPNQPNNIYSKPLCTDNKNDSEQGKSGNASGSISKIYQSRNIIVPSPPSTRPPTPPSVSLIPKQRPLLSDIGFVPNTDPSGNYFTFPDLEVTLTAPTPEPSQFSGERFYIPTSVLSGRPGSYYVASQSSSSTSDHPRSEHLSTSVTSQDDITSSSATSGEGRHPHLQMHM